MNRAPNRPEFRRNDSSLAGYLHCVYRALLCCRRGLLGLDAEARPTSCTPWPACELGDQGPSRNGHKTTEKPRGISNRKCRSASGRRDCSRLTVIAARSNCRRGAPADARRRGVTMGGHRESLRPERGVFRTSRLLDFCSEKELTAQTGHPPAEWPLVVAQGAGRQRARRLRGGRDRAGDRRPRRRERDHRHRQRPRDAARGGRGGARLRRPRQFPRGYVAPDRGAQGNALKTLVAMPFVLDGKTGRVEVDARGIRHEIAFAVDPIRQQPVIRHQQHERNCKNRHLGDGALAGFSKLNPGERRRAGFYKSPTTTRG